MSKPLGRSALLAATVAMSAALILPAAFAAPPSASALAEQLPAARPPPPAPPTRVRPQSTLDQLGLTEAQRTRITQLQQSSMAKDLPFMQTLRAKQDAFAGMLPGASGYQSAANALATAEANAARAHVLNEAAFRTDVYHLLTPDQRSKLGELVAQQRARRAQWLKAQAQRDAAASAPASSGT